MNSEQHQQPSRGHRPECPCRCGLPPAQADADRRASLRSGVLKTPEFRMALARRDIQLVVRLLQRHGLSQRRIAALTGQSQSEISEILAGRRVTNYHVLVRIADGLGVPRGWMGLAYDTPDGQPPQLPSQQQRPSV